jgi:hypothetical protein
LEEDGVERVLELKGNVKVEPVHYDADWGLFSAINILVGLLNTLVLLLFEFVLLFVIGIIQF